MVHSVWFYAVRTLQILWLSPATILVWFFYIFLMHVIFRDLVWVGWAEYGVAEFKLAKEDLEPWYIAAWKDWSGWSGPMVIIRRDNMDAASIDRTRKHEIRHCWQQFIFGIFHYPFYLLMSIFIWLFLKAKHAYLDNPFERDARRAAGQRVDIPREQWPHGPNDSWPWW